MRRKCDIWNEPKHWESNNTVKGILHLSPFLAWMSSVIIIRKTRQDLSESTLFGKILHHVFLRGFNFQVLSLSSVIHKHASNNGVQMWVDMGLDVGVQMWADMGLDVIQMWPQGRIFIFFTGGVEKLYVGCKSYAICHSWCFGRGMKWQTKVRQRGEVKF